MLQDNDKLAELERENTFLKSQVESLHKIQGEKDVLLREYNGSQSRFKTILEESSLGNKIINDDLKIIQVNKALVAMLGYADTELVGRKITEFTHPEFVQEWEKLRRELWCSADPHTSFGIDTCLIKKDNSSIWCHVTSIIFFDNDRQLGYTILEDISVREEAKRIKDELIRKEHLLELKSLEKKQQQELFELAIQAQEEERERIAEHLHDSLGQMLYAVKLNLDQFKIKVHGGDKEQLERVNKLLTESISECRKVSHDLLPRLLKDFGLDVAIKDMCEQLAPGIKVNCELIGLFPIEDKYVELVVFRTVQELLLNAVEHAKANQVTCKVKIDRHSISVLVDDNGKGFPSEIKGNGIGLSAIKSRIGLMGGSVEISSKMNQGTKVVITLPREKV